MGVHYEKKSFHRCIFIFLRNSIYSRQIRLKPLEQRTGNSCTKSFLKTTWTGFITVRKDGLIEIDFKNAKEPKIDVHQYDFEKAGYSLVITNTGGSHANLSEEYSAIPKEMRSVARYFGKDHLADVDEKEFYARISRLKKELEISDRAILRSAHFFADNARVAMEAQALENGDIRKFLDLVNASGESSAALLQNLYSNVIPQDQPITLALMMSQSILRNVGACRVHGGGFAGTIQAFVPKEKIKEYVASLEGLFGAGSCYVLHIRPKGAAKIIG